MKNKTEHTHKEIDNWNEQSVTPEEIMHIYKKHGTILTSEQAKDILDFMQIMVNIALDQVFEDQSREK